MPDRDQTAAAAGRTLTPAQADRIQAALISAAVEQFAWMDVATWLDELIAALNAVSARVKSP